MTYREELTQEVSKTYKEGDKVYDSKFDEIFRVNWKRDTVVLFNHPERFRMATPDEVTNYINRGRIIF